MSASACACYSAVWFLSIVRLLLHWWSILIWYSWRFPEMGGTPTWTVYNWTSHQTWWFGGCPYLRKPPYSWMFFWQASDSTATQNIIDFLFLSVSLSSGWTINICNMTRPRNLPLHFASATVGDGFCGRGAATSEHMRCWGNVMRSAYKLVRKKGIQLILEQSSTTPKQSCWKPT